MFLDKVKRPTQFYAFFVIIILVIIFMGLYIGLFR